MKRLAAALVAGGMLAGSVSTASAVTLNGLEWRQVTDTTGLSWNQISGVCNGLNNACSGSIGSIQFDNWTWATQSEVGDMFSAYSSHPGGINVAIDSGYLIISTDLKNLELTQRSGPAGVYGLTADLIPLGLGTYAYIRINTYNTTTTLDSRGNTTTTTTRDFLGAWLYETPVTPVPLPAAFSLLGGALSLLGFFGWRRKRMAAA